MSTVVATITEADVDASIARVISSAESIWDEWAWQVENETWLIKGYGSWDEMRRAVYGNLSSITAPRAERPELVARFRGAGLTQRETAETLGVTTKTIKRDEHPEWKGTNVPPEPDVVDAEIVDDPPEYVNRDTGEVTDKPWRHATNEPDDKQEANWRADFAAYKAKTDTLVQHTKGAHRTQLANYLREALNQLEEGTSHA